jgi:2-polyprenyl-3-methyl-5-hydroxy-6-metoxy-1,4-benzoquinol methylase
MIVEQFNTPVPADEKPGCEIPLPDYYALISDRAIQEVKDISHFAQSQYRDLDIRQTLTFYHKRYIQQLTDFKRKIEDSTIIADIGAGYGWLAMAFAFSTNAKVIAIEPDEARLEAGKKISGILGVGEKIDWRVGSLEELPMEDKYADVVYCIEVLEHVYKSESAVHNLCQASKDLLIVTTPNLWFPIIAHDTRLPFCHWLPIPVRKVYARVFNRQDREIDNLFWSPYSLQKNMPEFRPISNWLTFSSYKKHLETFPFYLPYGRGRWVKSMGLPKRMYYGLASNAGIYSHWLVPSLSYVFQRQTK